MTVSRQGAAERRAAAELRQAAYQRDFAAGGRVRRNQVQGLGASRRVPTTTEIRAELTQHNGREMFHTYGFFTRYDMPYPMWDMYGEYDEVVRPGSGRHTLAANPDVAFLVNHKGVTMARTTNGSLVLEERDEGAWHDAWLNPARQDVKDLIVAIQDRNVDQMSYAFMIPDDGGEWAEDFSTFEIRAWDIHRGDVSAVNYGANPYTDIAGRAGEVLNELEHLPPGALPEAHARLGRRLDVIERDRIEVAGLAQARSTTRPPALGRRAPSLVALRDETGAGMDSPFVRRLHSRVTRTHARYTAMAARNGLGVDELLAQGLPWYEVRNVAEDGAPEGDKVPTVYLFDEIGGSFGVSAKQFVADLEAIDAPVIHLRINSPGGSVFDGLTMHSALLHHDARIVGFVDGLAASAASVVAMGSDELVMMPGSELMIHDASATFEGNASDAGRLSTFLNRQSDNIADMYARKAGGDRGEWRELMQAETWAFGREAVEMRLADRLFDDGPVEAADPDLAEVMTRSYDMGGFGFRYAGRQAAPGPRVVRDGGQPARSVPAPEVPRGRPLALVEALARADGIDV
jgi:HK97 family phage prohead protease